MSGATSYYGGLAAEDQVAEIYLRQGKRLAGRRWRGQGGEIDLIVEDGPVKVFVEVKRGKTHNAAAARVSARQIQRIFAAAGEYLGTCPDGQLTETRFDVATVDGRGQVEVQQNAFL